MKIAILTSPDQWFIPYAKKLLSHLEDAQLYFEHKEIKEPYTIVFILSYHQLIGEKYLKKNKHNIVIHESALPEGKGWAPLIWQIVEGKNSIPFTMFEASYGVDNGDIYMQKYLSLNGYELHDELRNKQAKLTIEMCLEFVKNYQAYIPPKKQEGNESFYPKRTPLDSQIDPKKTILEQFNLLRTVCNEEYPAFFEIDGHKFSLKIEKA